MVALRRRGRWGTGKGKGRQSSAPLQPQGMRIARTSTRSHVVLDGQHLALKELGVLRAHVKLSHDHGAHIQSAKGILQLTRLHGINRSAAGGARQAGTCERTGRRGGRAGRQAAVAAGRAHRSPVHRNHIGRMVPVQDGLMGIQHVCADRARSRRAPGLHTHTGGGACRSGQATRSAEPGGKTAQQATGTWATSNGKRGA